jgi:hypothetical protein
VHQAREACLFKKADKSQCDKLHSLEADIADLRHEGRELYRVGDLQEVLKKSEELMTLDRQADELRREIVGQAKEGSSEQDDRELVHRVANKKGQEWGWDWSWGFPKPFDDDSTTSQSDRERWHRQHRRGLDQLQSEARNIFGDDAWNDATHTVFGALEANPMFRAMVGEKAWNDFRDFVDDTTNGDQRRSSWAPRFPAPADTRQIEDAAKYSPRSLEQDDEMKRTGVNWREAYEDLVRAEKQAGANEACPWRRHRANSIYPKRVPWEGEETNEEPSYEYSHDHEDQHDDPPTPKAKQGRFDPREDEDKHIGAFLAQSSEEKRRLWAEIDRDAGEQGVSDARMSSTETELDAYEHLLVPEKSPIRPQLNPAQEETTNGFTPSILSTMTTTERTVALDGSITTKVVLKKRFADGREESSESVHTQRGDEPSSLQNAWNNISKPEPRPENKPAPQTKSGWFWSS